MATMWRKAMLYLGLAPDDEYDDSALAVPPAPSYDSPELEDDSGVRTITREAASEAGVRTADAARPDLREGVGAGVSTDTTERHGSASVRTFRAARSKPHVVSPRSFNDAQQVADRFMASQPVILNIQAAEIDLSRRLLDFASGLCYGLGGHIEKVNDRVYLLTPADAEVSDEELRRLQQRGLVRE